MTETLRTEAWLMRRNFLFVMDHPGMLQLADGRLSFTTSSQKRPEVPMSRRQLRALEKEVQKTRRRNSRRKKSGEGVEGRAC